MLHPVLNIASARLLLGAGSTVVDVDDSVLDSGQVPHGPLVGIPYAPDSLPTAQDAATPKVGRTASVPPPWARAASTRSFVLGGADAGAVTSAGELDPSHALYVQGPDAPPTWWTPPDQPCAERRQPPHQGPAAAGRRRLRRDRGRAAAGHAAWLATLRAGTRSVSPGRTCRATAARPER
ncbi:hypothetical protein GXW82_40210 [Streptacidiphilus sp. 4-A2]|nr:hypothetical protein [Streptacidiphilus sp. 4-A2]